MGGKITLAIRRRFGYNSRVSSAGVMELVDVVDSKSTAGDSVPVRVRSPAPYRVFLTNLRVGWGHSISFCLFVSLWYIWAGIILLFFVMSPCRFYRNKNLILPDSSQPLLYRASHRPSFLLKMFSPFFIVWSLLFLLSDRTLYILASRIHRFLTARRTVHSCREHSVRLWRDAFRQPEFRNFIEKW